MRKIIAAINTSVDGNCDHTAGIADEELHQHYAELLSNSDAVLYGRITYQLMEYWRTLAKKPSGEKTMDEFAVMMDKVPKIVFSQTLQNVDWHSAKLANQPIEDVISELKQQAGAAILVGSRSLIIQLLKLNLIDEFQLCIQPVLAGKGLQLFENIEDRTLLKLTNTKTFSGGAIILYYKPVKK